MKREMRAQIAQETLEIFKKGFYEVEGNKIEVASSLNEAISKTRLYTTDDFEQLSIPDGKYDTIIEVRNETTFAATHRMVQQEGLKDVACLNFASAKNPGGGFLNGSQAQEESLARASGMYLCQITQDEMYEVNKKHRSCLYTDYMIYSKDVPVIRNVADQLLAEPYLVSILTAPAVNVGGLRQHRDEAGLARVEEVMRARTEKVLKVFAHEGHSTIILGAWGCGVFQNDPVKVAGYFGQLLLEGKYKGCFEKVVFAVLDKEAGTTFQVFNSIFA